MTVDRREFLRGAFRGSAGWVVGGTAGWIVGGGGVLVHGYFSKRHDLGYLRLPTTKETALATIAGATSSKVGSLIGVAVVIAARKRQKVMTHSELDPGSPGLS